MKSKADLVRGWLLKGNSDLSSVRICLANEQALDIACFHAQQAAEKYLKAFLTAHEINFPFIHNLEKLIDLCAEADPSFKNIKLSGQLLTPYAVEMRYDFEFWPDTETAREAYEAALKITALVLERLPPETKQGVV